MSDIADVGRSRTAGPCDFLDNCRCGPRVGIAATYLDPGVIDDDTSSPPCEQESILTAQSAPAAGDDRHSVVKVQRRHFNPLHFGQCVVT
ncbi:hypothetical protein A5675_03315 [Mycobacterium malmoense]|nr:hypothetical protein A5675_03315 [Mycobacterium malmoense]